MNQAQALQEAHRIGPRRPMPFPDSGKHVKLLICPTCKTKGLLWFYAPYEHGYPTKCIKCNAQAVIKRQDKTLHEIQSSGGFTPRAKGIRESEHWGLDATRFYDERRDMRSVGAKRMYSLGMVPAPVDAALR